MKNKYLILKNKHEKILNKFPQFFAFNEEQLKEGLKKMNVDKTQILSTEYGGFIKKSDRNNYTEMWKNINKESKEALEDEVYLYQAFKYELSNHEFCITYDYEDTLNCLGLEFETLTEKQKEILDKAKNEYLHNRKLYKIHDLIIHIKKSDRNNYTEM